MKKKLLLITTVFVLTNNLSAVVGSWIGSDGNWSDAGNWYLGIIPNGTDDIAVFDAPIAENILITLDVDVTLGQMNFGHPFSKFTVSDSKILTFDVSFLAYPVIENISGTHEIATEIILNQDTLILVTDNSRTIISKPIGGTKSIEKKAPGILELTAINTYSGPTLITSGTMILNGSLADTAVTIASEGTLQGTGTMGAGGAIVLNNGNISPGNSIGTLTIDGQYSQGSVGALHLEILTSSLHDQLIVKTGGVTLDGTLFLDYLPGNALHFDDQLILIDNSLGTGISGVFSDVIANNLHPAFQSRITYNPQSVVLSFEEQTVPVESFQSSSKNIFSCIGTMLLFTDRHLTTVRQNLNSSFSSNKNNKDTNYAFSFPMNIDPSFLTAEDKATSQIYRKKGSPKVRYPYQVYFGPIGSVGDTKTYKNQQGSDSWSAGALAGFDAFYDHSIWGVIASYEKLEAKVKKGWGNFDIQSLSLNGYGSWSFPAYRKGFVEGIAGLGYQWQNIDRNTFIHVAKGNPKSYSGNASIGAGYSFIHKRLTWVPKVSMQYMGYRMEDFHERGAGVQNHAYEKQSGNSLRPTLCLSVLGNEKKPRSLLLPELHVRYQRELIDPDSTIAFTGATLMGTNNLTVFGGGRDFVYCGGSLQVRPWKSISFEGSYDFEWNERFQAHYFFAGMQYRF